MTEAQPEEPVYDDRGNVRPRGTKGARPMTFEERVAVALETGSHPPEQPVDPDGVEAEKRQAEPTPVTTRKAKR